MSGSETALDIFYTPFSLFRQNLPLYIIVYALPLPTELKTNTLIKTKMKLQAMKQISMMVLMMTATVTAGAQDLEKYPWLDRSKSFRERADLLVGQMTLEEKVSQLGNRVADPVIRDGITIVPAYQYWNEANHGVIDDGPSTSFPCLKAMSSTWDLDLVQRCARATSDEARAHHLKTGKGLDYWCPTINMSRDPRWGRDEENYGEDVFLAGRLAVNYLKGLQEEPDANGYYKLVGCAKHFAGNNYEVGRHSTTTFVTEKNMREYYLPVFEQCVREGNVHSIMAAYNAFSTDLTEKNPVGEGADKAKGGLPCSANKMLLTDILRSEWGFNGYVVSDCAAVSDVNRATKHLFWGSYDANDADQVNRMEALSSSICLKAGLDNNCEFKNTTSVLQRNAGYAVSDEFKTAETQFADYATLTEEDIDRAVVRLMESRFALGEFDEPYVNVSWNSNGYQIEAPEYQALALEASQKTITLLKNEAPAGSSTGSAPILPITVDKKVALIGTFPDRINTGGYSGNAGPTYYSTPLEAFSRKLNFTVSDGTVQAEDFDEAVVSQRGADKNNQNKGYLENTAPGDIFLYKNVDFGDGCTNFEMAAASKSSGLGQVSFIFDSKDGEPFLTVSNEDTGNWTKWKSISASLDPNVVKGKHDLYVKLSGSNSYVGNYDYFKFYNPNANPLETKGPLYMVKTTDIVGEDATDEAIARAKAVAQKADVVLFLGGTANYSGKNDFQSGRESVDRKQLTLPGNQEEVLKALYEVNPNIVLVLYCGSSMDITWAKENLPGILVTWYNGQAQGQALCDIVFGDKTPAGKLTSTWYNSINELPQASTSSFQRDGMLEYNIDKWGYTYMYYGRGEKNKDTQAEHPMYPFGYGLSYTTFDYSDMAVSSTSIAKDGMVNVTASITNSGSRQGAEIVQLYANFNGNANYGDNGNMRHKLVGFARVELEAGETQQVTIPVSYESLSYYDENSHQYKVPNCTVTLELAASSEDIRMTKDINARGGVAKDTYLSNGTTVIQTVNNSQQLRKTDHIYTVMGAYVCPASDYDRLPKGIYVLNGMKYIKK